MIIEKRDLQLLLDQIGLNQRDIILLFAIQVLETPQTSSDVYTAMKQKLPNVNHKSRSYIYAFLGTMAKENFLSYALNERRKFYYLTDEANQKLVTYKKTYYDPINNLEKIARYLLISFTEERGVLVPESTHQYF